MPAIKVYKGAGAMIPLDEAKVARAFQCPWTGKLFATKPSYTKHLRELRETRMRTRARANKRIKLLNTLWNQTSFEDIIEWIELNGEFWFDQYVADRGWMAQKISPALRADFGIKVLYMDLTWGDCISNSHSCPHNGVTNWGRDSNRPRGYPGWSGTIAFKYSHKDHTCGSGVLRGTRLHTGTGGGGGNGVYRYEFKMFAADWPGLSNGQMILDLLNNKKPSGFVYGKDTWRT